MAEPETSTPIVETAQAERADSRFLTSQNLSALIECLVRLGYQVIAPSVRDGAFVLDEVASAAEVPHGWTEEQKAGEYRHKHGAAAVIFSHTPGLQSWKKYLYPAEVKLWSAQREHGTFRILNNERSSARPLAFLGVRPCDLAAIRVQDLVLTGEKHCDPIYAGRRKAAFIIAVECTRVAETCFCASMKTGPRAESGFDLALTELTAESGEHGFLVRAGSLRGREVMRELETTPASYEDLRAAESAIDEAARRQVRSIDNSGIRDLLVGNFDHPRWDEIAQRCLSCANCSMVCPTCFCTNVEDVTNIHGNHAERWRRWDSCFSTEYSYIHGGSIRSSAKARYRHWMMHKLAWWVDQFGTSGCVGCGRCITWCPVGIDITEEARALREGDHHGKP